MAKSASLSQVCQERKANPVNVATGAKVQIETDYVGPGPFPLQFIRYYSTQGKAIAHSSGSFDENWRHHYDRHVQPSIGQSPPTSAVVARPDGKIFLFQSIGGVFTPDADVPDRLIMTATGWQYITTADETETYDAGGRLTTITNRAGLTQTFAYNAQGKLASVTDAFGRSLTFTYDASNRIATMTDPGGGVYTYSYDPNPANYNLISVIFPGSGPASQRTRTYVYNEPAYAPPEMGLYYHLTGIVDENGQRFANFGYSPTLQGLATLSEHAGGAGKVTFQYAFQSTTATTYVDSSQSVTRTYGFAGSFDVLRNNSVDGPGPGCEYSNIQYDTGYLGQTTDFNGNVTTYQRTDASRKDLETSRTEASNRTHAEGKRTIDTAWHPTFRFPTLITEKDGNGVTLRQTTMGYDTAGNVHTRTVTDVPLSRSRTWTYTYNANGQVLTENGPRTDGVPDVTTYTYYANNATCTATLPGASTTGCRGQVNTIANALNHVTTIGEYDAHGQPLSIADPNGLVTTLAYDARRRLASRNVGGETTTYTYDNAGQLTRVTLPDGSFLEYSYDAAHRLTQIQDNLGNRIAYTLDAMGNRTLEQVFDPLGALAQTCSRVYSNLNRLSQEIGAQSQTTAFGYDNQGNVTSVDGPLAGIGDRRTYTYDALNRLATMVDPAVSGGGTTTYTYNALDQLASVKDARNLTTTYTNDGLNNLNQLASPDTGTTNNTYDAAGNLLTQADAKGQVTTYTYDALNRVTSIAYQGGATHTYQYDQGTNQKGRLTQITEPNSTTVYAYDQKGP